MNTNINSDTINILFGSWSGLGFNFMKKVLEKELHKKSLFYVDPYVKVGAITIPHDFNDPNKLIKNINLSIKKDQELQGFETFAAGEKFDYIILDAFWYLIYGIEKFPSKKALKNYMHNYSKILVTTYSQKIEGREVLKNRYSGLNLNFKNTLENDDLDNIEYYLLKEILGE